MTTEAAIIYPETDGMPLSDGEFQAPIYRRVVGKLEIRFKGVSGARVNGNTFIYYIEGNPRRSVSPDCYVALNLPPESIESIERNNVYLLWEVGKAPDFVLEIASRSTSDADLGRKWELYAELGVSEYWRFDSTGGDFYGEPLVGDYLADGKYHRIDIRDEGDGRIWSHSEALNLDLWWIDGELQFWDPVSNLWLLNQEEERLGRLAAEGRTEEERLGRLAAEGRMEEERAARLSAENRAEEAEARMAEMEAELRRLRDE